MERPQRGVLFLCVANSVRSQMAEGFARALAPPDLQVYSAGSMPGVLNRSAVRVMAECGIDISAQRSKGVDEVFLDEVDTVVTLCADEVCPPLPAGVRNLHWPCLDPAAVSGESDPLASFRRVRDVIRARVQALLG